MFSTTFTKFKKLFQPKDHSSSASSPAPTPVQDDDPTNKRDSTTTTTTTTTTDGVGSIFDCYNSTTSSSGFSSLGSNTSNYSLNSSYHFYPYTNPHTNEDEKNSRSKALALFTSSPAVASVTSSSWSSSNSSTWSFFENSSSSSSSIQQQQQQHQKQQKQKQKQQKPPPPIKTKASSSSTSSSSSSSPSSRFSFTSKFQTRHSNKITSQPPPSSSSPSFLCKNTPFTYRRNVYKPSTAPSGPAPASAPSFRSVPPIGLTRNFIMKLNISEDVRTSLLRRAQVVEDLDLDFSDRECSTLTESTYSTHSTLSYTSDVSEMCKNEREEIRRRLAMTDDDKENGDDNDDTDNNTHLTGSMLSNPRLQTSLEGAQNMQICFIPDDILDDDDDDDVTIGSHVINDVRGERTGSDDVISTSEDDTLSTENEASQPLPAANSSSSTPTSSTAPLSNRRPDPRHIASRQSQLQTEATLALAQASTMARMQLEVERQTKKKSPIADMVGIPTLGSGRRLRLSNAKLTDMNVAQLQVLVNDLHSQIELLNEDLVHLLIERDDLHMEQDSMLVDIEDLTSHCHDPKATNNNKTSLNNNRPGHRKDVRRH